MSDVISYVLEGSNSQPSNRLFPHPPNHIDLLVFELNERCYSESHTVLEWVSITSLFSTFFVCFVLDPLQNMGDNKPHLFRLTQHRFIFKYFYYPNSMNCRIVKNPLKYKISDMFRFTQEPSSGSQSQCLAKITNMVPLCLSI